MNKKLEQFFETEGLSVSGNSAYGNLHGFEVSFSYFMLDTESPIQALICCYTNDEQNRQINQELSKIKNRYFKWQFTRYGLYIGINGLTMNSVLKELNSLLTSVCDILKSEGALGLGHCPVCGNELSSDSQVCTVESFKVTIGSDCVGDLNKAIEEENADFESAPNNYLKGFFGALIGGVVGGIVAIILYLIGFIAAASAIVAVVVGAKLYCKFGGKSNKTMLVIVSATSIVCIMLSVLIIYLIAAVGLAAEAGLNLSAFEAFSYMLDNRTEFARGFYGDLAMMAVFTIAGVIYEAISMRKMIKRPEKLK